MATTITAGNSTNGAAITPDNTGTLALKTGSGAGTTAISIDASQNVAITGSLTVGGIPAGGNYALVAYTSPATGPAAWDANAKKAAGLKAVKVTVVGAGGSGGSITPGTTTAAAGGGGGGGAAIEYIPAPSIPGPVDITAGPGTNSFGAFCSATAGSNASPVSTTYSAGAAGGVGSSGSVNFDGGGGISGAAGAAGGAGGNSIFGAGARGTIAASASVSAGVAGGDYGGGGSGAVRVSPTSSTASGGSGAPGIVIVEEFY